MKVARKVCSRMGPKMEKGETNLLLRDCAAPLRVLTDHRGKGWGEDKRGEKRHY